MKFEKLNLNPKGIRACDCVIRAIALATAQTWDKVYMDLCELGLKMKRVPNEKQVYEKYLEQKGWTKHKQPRAYDYTNGHCSGMSKYTVNELGMVLDLSTKTMYRLNTDTYTETEIKCDYQSQFEKIYHFD